MTDLSAPAPYASRTDLRVRRPLTLPVQTFDHRELTGIFDLYGRMVALGEWRDYALDFTPSRAVFSIFRRTCETPLFQIIKDVRTAHRFGAYAVVGASGAILKRGPELAQVLRILQPRPRLTLI